VLLNGVIHHVGTLIDYLLCYVACLLKQQGEIEPLRAAPFAFHYPGWGLPRMTEKNTDIQVGEVLCACEEREDGCAWAF
jgi:hypothetical protein